MRWAGHVTSMEEIKNIHSILDRKPEGNGPLRRYGCRW